MLKPKFTSEDFKQLLKERNIAGRIIPIGWNRHQVIYPNGDIGFWLYDGELVLYKADNTIQLNSRGWQTMTTKKTMNHVLPSGLFIKGSGKSWSVHDTISQKVIPYQDGMNIPLPSEAFGHEG